MAYADQSQSGRRTAAIIIVALLHLALGYAFITGLAFNVIKKATQDLKAFDVQEEAPPPEAPPPPPPKADTPPPPPIAPPPIVQAPTVQVQPMVTIPHPPPAPPIHEQAPPAPPPKPSEAKAAVIKGDPQFGITDEDYPPSSQRNGEEGTTRFAYDITPDGRMTNCHITGSSGSPALDEATCTLATRRARFKPAQDTAGNPIASHGSRSIRWQIPKE